MTDDSSFDEDFAENTFCTTEDEAPKKETKKEENHFEILSIENIAQEVYDIIYKVQAFLAVSKNSLLNKFLTLLIHTYTYKHSAHTHSIRSVWEVNKVHKKTSNNGIHKSFIYLFRHCYVLKCLYTKIMYRK